MELLVVPENADVAKEENAHNEDCARWTLQGRPRLARRPIRLRPFSPLGGGHRVMREKRRRLQEPLAKEEREKEGEKVKEIR